LELNSGIGRIGTGANEDGKFLSIIASNVGNAIRCGILTDESVKVITRPTVTHAMYSIADRSKFESKRSIDCCTGNSNVNVNAGSYRP
jgi:carbamoylphosphate synthase large subunit